MAAVIDSLLTILRDLAGSLPLPVFAFVGAFVEEIIAPIPSPFVMTLAGSLAEAQGQPLLFLVLLAVAGAISKTVGALIVYLVADRLEDLLSGRVGQLLGLSHKQVVNLGKRLEKGRAEWLIIFALRAIPIMPTAPVSFAAGVLQLKRRVYLTSTAAGLLFRNLFYLYLGYSSTAALEELNNSLGSLESIGYIVVLLAAAATMFYIYRHRQENL